MTSFSLVSFVAILIVSSSVIYPSSGISEEILKTICSVEHSGARCMSILKSDPRTASADFPQLSLISVELAIKQSDSNIKSFTEIVANSTDPQITKRCRPCIGIYKDIKSQVQEAHHKSEYKLYADISEIFDASLHLAYKCAALCSVNSIALDLLSQDMISRCETCQSVNKYMVSQSA
ncbi:hypothetical protein Dsin_022490 [Dipteronia sinensis]|uniref:Pectinesterase inhibitor domain-containing protein n=1 Tax=Dipteronia sinensis TaxID=43782 RepID=A0AAD9Z606_9ROSI|nr:hypothetical protein Dsin_032764 [Dipteronia sinensis]KAK3199075.1 hypothetical protein Dsin_022490 [Dipteronia sinensis]